ncbi:MAG: bifunctional [glutamate--ammonia ligase]-adenylyl-L-tyrosine phosphorylase/[glutamate--ammonia-ligase] adenylyltransferase [Alcaligenaceae bacterium]|nr:bifunctional [glutamate--ammonia ligase]-adenylyl-L-tyrosine phosphorylase/[glutamate--ammonia-ligase] adenylyltransferase [Alcaligenaceae bacterium]
MMPTKSLTRALEWSGYLQRKISTNEQLKTELSQDILHPITADIIQQWFTQASGQPVHQPMATEQCKQVLRKLRNRAFCALMVRDINGLACFEEVTQSMSFLADLAVQQAYMSIMRDLVHTHGEPINPETGRPMEMIILGMGKLGGKELNVSSDIDLIMLYAQEGETTGRRPLSHHEFYGRLTQRMMPVLSELNADGHVFRTDLRLRPDGDAGPLAWSLDALENYLITQGREWERYAWLKARIIPVKYFEQSSPKEDIAQLKSLRTPFVYRKYFDFDALASLRQLRERIRQDWQRKALNRNGVDSIHNIKLGEGGIREVEFTVQLSQLIRGGRMPSLQLRGLLPALHAEIGIGLITKEEGLLLENAYRFLRRVEHMLQYREDEQTHLLPADPERFAALAKAMNMEEPAFRSQLNEHRRVVSRAFRNAFRIAGMGEEPASGSHHSDTPDNTDLSELIQQFFSPESHEYIENRIKALLNSSRIRTLSGSSRTRLKKLLPTLLETAAKTDDPQLTCGNLFDLIEAIAQRSAYIALLAEYPETLARVARIMSASHWAAGYLIRNPILLDGLIDWQTLMQNVDFSHIATQLSKDLDACVLQDGQPDVEQQMNIMRDVQKQVSFQLLAQDLSGGLSVEKLADHLSDLADLLLEESLKRIWPAVKPKPEQTNEQVPDYPRFAVIAYGKLGGKELGYASDLDLVLLFDDPADYALEVYAKLGRRLSTWLSSMTSSGRMYEIDLRLRPDGDAGLLAISVDTFEKYQLEHAWPWEHQALTRARFCAGDKAIGKRFEQIRRNILLKERDREQLRQDIIDMRAKMRAGHPNHSGMFDVKHDHGGMVDIEFMTQYLVLAYSHQYPRLLDNLGNIALLKIAAEGGFIPEDLANEVADAYRTLRKTQHAVRLRGQEKARIDSNLLLGERKAVDKLWEIVFPGTREQESNPSQ